VRKIPLRLPGWNAAFRAAFTLIIVLPLLIGCDREPQQAAAAPPPPDVGVRPAEMKGVARAYEFVGRIKAIDIVAVRARVEGFLEKIAFREGQDVKAGDLLYQIEKAPYQAQVDQAKANLAAAEAQAANADVQYRRTLQLAKEQFMPQATLDRDKATMVTAHAQVEQAQAALDLAELNLSYTDIRSPIDGRIGRTALTEGNLVDPASGVLATIVSQDPIYVVFPVSLRQLEEIRDSRRRPDGSLVKIQIVLRLPSGREYTHPGTWNYTEPQVDQTTDTVVLRGTMPNPERELIDGQFVTAMIRERREFPRLVVPQAALQLDQAGYYVLVVDDQNKVEMRRIAIGPTQGAEVVVQSGLKPGERVIVEGMQKVRPGQLVKVTDLASKQGG
jgi:membrane fusion protein (multidrug efflux system)